MKDLDIYGIVPAVALPRTADEKIDEPALRKYIRWVANYDVKAVSVNAHAGEGPYLDPEERVRVLEIWAEELNGRIPIIAGLSAVFTDEAIRRAKEAKKAGADGLLVFPLSVFMGEPLPVELPYNYHKALADEVGLPQVLFQVATSRGGVNYAGELLERLLEIPQVIGIKEASFDCQRFIETVQILHAAPRRIAILTGNDDFIFESFVLGADGGLLGFSTLAIQEQIDMLNLVKQGEITKAKTIWDRIRPLEALIFSRPFRNYVVRTKEALTQLGVIPRSTMRRPYLPISPAERDQVRSALIAAQLLTPAKAASVV